MKQIVPIVKKKKKGNNNNNNNNKIEGKGEEDNMKKIQEDEENEKYFMKQLSNIYRKNAYSLFSFIKTKNLLKWNSAGELLMQNNKPIKNSNIKKLIMHAISQKSTKPIGYKFFYETLKQNKIPNFLKIKNLKKYTDETAESLWRPPGKLDINK